jgi:DNA-binding XRE family transcriptional regulator
VLSSNQIHFGTLVRMGRAGLAWTQGDLARHANVSARTIKNIEACRKPRSRTQAKIRDALAEGGVDLEGDCSVRIRGDAPSTPSAVVEISSECRP